MVNKNKLNIKLLQKLLDAHGPSGQEGAVRHIIENEIKKHVDRVYTDKMGNLIAHECVTKKKGKRSKVMLAAHMDEVGLMVKSIDKKGRINITNIGGIDPITILGQRIYIKTAKNEEIRGIVTHEDLSDSLEISELPKLSKMFIDTGLNKAELEKKGVNVGSFVSLEEKSTVIGNNDYIIGKSLDDRIGCFVLVEVAKMVKRVYDDVFYVFTVQEEVGLYGAKGAAFHISPDWAIAVDTTTTDETFKDSTRVCGGGPCIIYKDADMIANPELNKEINKISKKLKIPIQRDVGSMGTTDALSISMSREGVPSTSVNVAIRNIHSTISMGHLGDIADAIDILKELLKKPFTFEGEW
ncbi:M42 family metallopeptidase [Candidatus Aenigmatarchaeota archaeon]